MAGHLKLNVREKADICSYANLFGIAATFVGVAFDMPWLLRCSFVIPGVLIAVAANARLYLAATGRIPFTDDTYTRLSRFNSGGSARID